MTLPDEPHLAALAAQLLGSRRGLTAAERALINPDLIFTEQHLNAVRAEIVAGDDPLGTAFLNLRSAEARRARGAVYTPTGIVDAMLEWALGEPGAAPARVVDPGTGSGRFLLNAARCFPFAQLIAVEIDPLAGLLLRANAAVLGFSDRLRVHVGDYRTLKLAPITGRTLFIGNPPYVRHHDISDAAKAWFGKTAEKFGFKASKLAGLHVHFFMRTRELAQPGDFGAFITSSEWIDVNYGSTVRAMLADGLGGTALHVIDPSAHPFDGAMTTGAIACFRVGNRPETFRVRQVASIEQLSPLGQGTAVTWEAVQGAGRWSTLIRPTQSRPEGVIELGELFRVHRGQVTGKNAVWIVGPDHPFAASLPVRFLFATITKARELIAAGTVLRNAGQLKRVVDLPIDLSDLDRSERRAVNAFLAWAREHDAHESFIATHRRAWWTVGLREPPPILVTYMARRAPTFVLNSAGARYINIAHGLYPRQPMNQRQLDGVLRYLRQTVSTDGGRTYAGGLVKYEPRELERLYIPDLNLLSDISAR